jgi:hypothetical protein
MDDKPTEVDSTIAGFLERNGLLVATTRGKSSQMTIKDQLKSIEYLVGVTWTTQGELPGVGKFTAERTYRWALGGNFIEQRHVMRFSTGEMETKGMIGWDPEKKAIVAWGFGSDGGIATSRADPPTPTEIRFEGVRVGDFNAGPIRATNKKESDDEFVEIAESKKSDVWVPMFTFRFTRAK